MEGAKSLYGAFRQGLSGLSEAQRSTTYGLRHSPVGLSEEVPQSEQHGNFARKPGKRGRIWYHQASSGAPPARAV